MATTDPIELLRDGKTVNNLLTVVAYGTILRLQDLPLVKRRNVRTRTVDGKPTHYVNVAFFNRDEEIDAEVYLKDMREQFPYLIFEVKN